jgi:hypothetical protein
MRAEPAKLSGRQPGSRYRSFVNFLEPAHVSYRLPESTSYPPSPVLTHLAGIRTLEERSWD